ncbi:MAG: TRAP transporter small permease [Brucellaceae bacterium]|nr:TRAP transporter small permease [Brucellaceae bacterium]
MRAFETWITRATIWIGGTTLVLMVVQIMLDVFMRQLAGTAFPATAELVAKYYMVAVSFLPVAYTEVKRRQVEATLFTDMMPQKARMPVLFFGFLLSFGIYGLLTYGTAREAMRQTSQGAYVEAGTLDFYTWPSYWILPVAFGLMTVLLGMRVVAVARGSFIDKPHDPAEEIDSHAGEQN